MKKNILYVTIASILIGVGGVTTHASEKVETSMETSVSEGSLKVLPVKGDINFGQIEPLQMKHNENEHVTLYPTLKYFDFMQMESNEDYIYGNPYNPDYSDIISPATTFAMPSMITIDNNSLAIDEFTVKLSRTPFMNSNEESITGDNLYMGEFKDQGTFDNTGAYEMAKYVTVTSDDTIVASYNGTTAKGIHAISPLSKTADNHEVIVDYDYVDKNIQLVMDNHTNIPNSGNYSAKLIWTVEIAPN